MQELETELLKHDPSGAPVSPLQLQLVVETLNTCIRNRGLSAKEILLQRDQQTSEQVLVKDDCLSKQQHNQHTYNHPFSSKSKAPSRRNAPKANVILGDLGFMNDEQNKNRARDGYLITKLSDWNALLQELNEKFMSHQYMVPLEHTYLAFPSSSSNIEDGGNVKVDDGDDDDNEGMSRIQEEASRHNQDDVSDSEVQEDSCDSADIRYPTQIRTGGQRMAFKIHNYRNAMVHSCYLLLSVQIRA